jgi:hypothetical protein
LPISTAIKGEMYKISKKKKESSTHVVVNGVLALELITGKWE